MLALGAPPRAAFPRGLLRIGLLSFGCAGWCAAPWRRHRGLAAHAVMANGMMRGLRAAPRFHGQNRLWRWIGKREQLSK